MNFSKNFKVLFNCLNELALETESRNNINMLSEYGLFIFSNFFLSILNVLLYFKSIINSPNESFEKSTIISGSEKFFQLLSISNKLSEIYR